MPGGAGRTAAVPRAGDGLTRIGFGVGRFLSRLLASREQSRAPSSLEELDSPPSRRAGRQPGTDRRTARRAHPADPRREARQKRGFAPRPRPWPWPWPWPGWGCGGGSGPWLGAGQDSHPGGSLRRRGQGRRGEARFPSKNAHQNFCFSLPAFLKAKAIIYSPFRCAAFSI